MGMPVTVEIADAFDAKTAIDAVFNYFTYIDDTFSTFKETSEITKINNGLVEKKDFSQDMKTVFELAEKTKQETNGYFNIVNNKGVCDPSGIVKGWAIQHAAQLLCDKGFKNHYVEAGGDIQVFGLPTQVLAQAGKNENHLSWSVGIKNPFNTQEIIKVVYLKNNEGIATSGTYERGAHIYNPKNRKETLAEIMSITVIAKNVYEADRIATAAFAMQRKGIRFIEDLPGFEAYVIDNQGIATMTNGFEKYTIP